MTACVSARDALGAGLHQELSTVLHLRDLPGPRRRDQRDRCVVAVQEELDHGVYVDLDELAERLRLRVALVPEVWPLGPAAVNGIDVEKPADASTGHALLAVTRLDQATLEEDLLVVETKLPVHFRYQAPGDTEYVDVPLYPPRNLWFGCNLTKQQALPMQEAAAERHVEWLATHGMTEVRLMGLCDPPGALVPALEVQVPVGQLADEMLVHSVTFLVTMAGALLVALLSARNAGSKPQAKAKAQ